MIKGMTGYGTALFTLEKVKGIVEIRSVNHRYLDIVSYLPNGFGFFEEKIKKMLQKEILRGRISVSIKLLDNPKQIVELNEEIVDKYIKFKNVLQKKFQLSGEVSIRDIFLLPGVFAVKEQIIDKKQLWLVVEKKNEKSY